MKSIKLNQLNAHKLDSKSANQIRGGKALCCCGCAYADKGGSSVNDNHSANDAKGLRTPGYNCLPEFEITYKPEEGSSDTNVVH